MGWNELQKLIFAKKSLKGVAKLFVLSEKRLNSWNALKKSLLSEFKSTVSSKQIHKQLGESKRRANENAQEYLYRMKDIASRGKVEEEALIQYVIDGIDELSLNKSVLYGARNLSDFKRKLKDYQIINIKSKFSDGSVKGKKWQPMFSDAKSDKKEIACYNCGEKGHLANVHNEGIADPPSGDDMDVGDERTTLDSILGSTMDSESVPNLEDGLPDPELAYNEGEMYARMAANTPHKETQGMDDDKLVSCSTPVPNTKYHHKELVNGRSHKMVYIGPTSDMGLVNRLQDEFDALYETCPNSNGQEIKYQLMVMWSTPHNPTARFSLSPNQPSGKKRKIVNYAWNPEPASVFVPEPEVSEQSLPERQIKTYLRKGIELRGKTSDIPNFKITNETLGFSNEDLKVHP
ncbi:uncharacterized protein LOC122319695 [Drosophila yakuba]|uniref:uncharacterized protein LOC122319695 n=1 Tax=Drosophila yakuba TaxID=7245 RepID=UPI001C8A241C|nr:uncharacterized protein LOC122319695 [Drosophila yakuba]